MPIHRVDQSARCLVSELSHLRNIRRLFQKFPALYIKKHNTTTLTSLLFHIISANQCTHSVISAAFVYQSCRRVHLAPEERPSQTQWRHCHLKNVCHSSALSAVGTNRSRRVLDLANILDEVIIHSYIQPLTSRRRNSGGVGRQFIIQRRTPHRSFPRHLLFSASHKWIYIEII